MSDPSSNSAPLPSPNTHGNGADFANGEPLGAGGDLQAMMGPWASSISVQQFTCKRWGTLRCSIWPSSKMLTTQRDP